MLLLFSMFVAVMQFTLCFVLLSKYVYKLQTKYVNFRKKDKLILPPIYASRLLTSSAVFLFNAIHAYYNNIVDCALIIFICWVNSLNYWRYPTKGFRRNIDITSALFASLHLFFRATELLEDEQIYIYRVGMFTFCIWYCMALYFTNKNYSSLCHVNLHSTAIIFNGFLFEFL